MPRKYDDDDDDDDDLPPVKKKKPLSGMDSFYGNTNMVILVLFSLCCNGLCLLPLILSVIGLATCTDEKAKSNAKICLIISGIMAVIGIIANIVRFTMMAGGAPGGGGFNFK